MQLPLQRSPSTEADASPHHVLATPLLHFPQRASQSITVHICIIIPVLSQPVSPAAVCRWRRYIRHTLKLFSRPFASICLLSGAVDLCVRVFNLCVRAICVHVFTARRHRTAHGVQSEVAGAREVADGENDSRSYSSAEPGQRVSNGE